MKWSLHFTSEIPHTSERWDLNDGNNRIGYVTTYPDFPGAFDAFRSHIKEKIGRFKTLDEAKQAVEQTKPCEPQS